MIFLWVGVSRSLAGLLGVLTHFMGEVTRPPDPPPNGVDEVPKIAHLLGRLFKIFKFIQILNYFQKIYCYI